MEHTLTLHNDVQEVPLLATFIDTICEENAMDMEMSMNINLAVEEAVVNVMNYAFPKGVRSTILLEVNADDETVSFELRDDGAPFDPTAKKEVDVDSLIKNKVIGGLGIHLMRQYMDTIVYERKDGQNVLTMKKRKK